MTALCSSLFMDQYIKLIPENDWHQSPTTQSGKRVVDLECRSSKTFKKKLSISFLKILQDFSYYNSIKENQFVELELLKYNKDDFFAPHVDKQRTSNHVYALLILPPCETTSQNFFEGGDLLIGDMRIECSKLKKWTFVIFNIKQIHSIEVITSGTRYVFKGILESVIKKELIFVEEYDEYFSININENVNQTNSFFDNCWDFLYYTGCKLSSTDIKYYDYPSYKKKFKRERINYNNNNNALKS
jgi:predicted 2-oxoglutarate/Fe(II)-dependent dioxygenase YbiX